MEPRISLISLGVADLERAIRFYRDGLGLSLDPRETLAEDALLLARGEGFRGFTLAHNPHFRIE